MFRGGGKEPRNRLSLRRATTLVFLIGNSDKKMLDRLMGTEYLNSGPQNFNPGFICRRMWHAEVSAKNLRMEGNVFGECIEGKKARFLNF